MHDATRDRRGRLWPALLLIVVVSPTWLPAAETCDADVEAELMRQEPVGESTRLEFKVTVSAEGCAQVTYDLMVEERLPNGQTKRVRKPSVVKLHDGGLDEAVRHEMPAGISLLSYEAEVVECRPCSDF